MQKAANRANSAKVNLIVDLIIFVAFLVVTAPRFTGIAIHEWLSIAFAAMIITHLLLHWSWLVETTRRIFTTAPLQARINYLLNLLLFIDITLAIFTGLMLSRSVLPFLGLRIAIPAGSFWRTLHVFTDNFALLIVGLHIALHWKWITNNVGRYIFKPAGNATPLTLAPRYTKRRATMKLVGRTLVILLAALVVIGATAAFAQSHFARTLIPAPPPSARGDAPPAPRNDADATGTNSNNPAGRPASTAGRPRPGRGDRINLFAGFDLIKNLAIMAFVVALVVFLPAGVRRIRQGRGDKASLT